MVIPNVIELRGNIYVPKQELHPHFISVRTLVELYRIDIILQAYQRVLANYPDATLDILGDGDKRSDLEQYVARHNLTGVRFIGQVPNEKIYDYLSKNDILLSAPMIDNMPVSIMEAMNAGLLVISSNVGGVPYMIEDGKSGLLFESGNAEQMAERMEWALTHQVECLQMIEKAHMVVQKYSWQQVRNQILPLYA